MLDGFFFIWITDFTGLNTYNKVAMIRIDYIGFDR